MIVRVALWRLVRLRLHGRGEEIVFLRLLSWKKVVPRNPKVMRAKRSAIGAAIAL